MTSRRGRPFRALRCNPGGMAPTMEIHLHWSYLKARLQEADSPSLDDALIANDGRRLGSKREVLEFLTELEPVGPVEARMPSSPTSSKPAPDLARITAHLRRHDVRYLLVGGVAGIVHGGTRPTDDVDYVADGGLENLRRFAVALLELNARVRVGGLDDAEASLLPVVHDGQVLERTEISTWRTDAGNLDVLSDIPDREGKKLRYDDLAQRADVVVIDGVAIPVASLEDVIGSKEGADRAKDREVLPELRAVAQSSNRG